MKKFVKFVVRSAWLVALFSLVIACEEHIDPKPPATQPPAQIIPVAQAKQMFDSYSDRRVPIIKSFEEKVDSTQEFHPTRYGEYDYETVKNYMAFIESEAALAKVKIGGLRFYFTNYPDAASFDNGTPVKYPRQNSFILVPTTEIDGKQQGFITRTTDDGGRTIVSVKDWLQEQPIPIQDQNEGTDTPKQIGALQKGNYVGSMKPQLLFINPVTGIASPVQIGSDVSLILNEINLRPPPPDQETDFDD
ncbi:hypothetical protein [Rasiella sp. SM2506]|uniref:hypothetical protein n=1 Tax=Rasiella sp. SM2506 TaxID=3423914 RepID=UPI003D7A63EC